MPRIKFLSLSFYIILLLSSFNAPVMTQNGPIPEIWLGLRQYHSKPGWANNTGVHDLFDAFGPVTNSQWAEDVRHLAVFKIEVDEVQGWTDGQVQQMNQWLKANGIALALEAYPMSTIENPTCQPQEGYGWEQTLKTLQRLRALGVTLKYIQWDMVDNYLVPVPCMTPELMRQQIDAHNAVALQIFPELRIDEIHHGCCQASAPLLEWIRLFHSHFHAFVWDTDHSFPDWPHVAKKLEDFCHDRGVFFDFIYGGGLPIPGNATATSNNEWSAGVQQEFQIYQFTLHAHPDVVEFQSWCPYPTWLLNYNNGSDRPFKEVLESYIDAF